MIVSYNVYDADTNLKINELPVPIDQDFDWTGRSSGTPYRVYTRTIDQAGNISDPGPVTEVSTDAFTAESEMDPADKAVVDQIIADAMAAGAGPGVIWKITSPKGHYMGSMGWRDYAKSRPISVDDHFRTGSATKPYVAAAVLRCVDQGLLSLEDTLDQFDTPKYKFSDVDRANKIKVKHLLMMRSGIFDEQKDLNMLLRLVLFPGMEFNEDAHFTIAKGHPLMFEPGTDFYYTNANYVMAGLVAQAVSGRNIRDIVIEDIFEPLGLTETSWPNTPKMPEPYAPGFGGGGQAATANTTGIHPSYAWAAGCIVTTINDMHKWVEAMRDNKILSPETYDVWMNTYCPIPMGSSFAPKQVGYGLGMYDYGDWKGHAGSWPGYECSPMWHPETGAVICIAENSQTAGNDGAGVATWSRMFPEIAKHLVPGSMPEKEYVACSVPADPRVFGVAPANLGYGGVSAAITGSGAASVQFTAKPGEDVFAFVNWDRQGAIPVVKYGGVDMTRIATAYHNNDAQYGGQALYRLAGAGTGVAKTLAVSGGTTWITGYGVSFGLVNEVSTASINHGMGTVHSHSVSNPRGITLQAFSAAYGSSDLGLPSNARRRAHFRGISPMLSVNTTIKTGDVSALSATVNRWSSIAVNLVIAQDVEAKPLPGVLKVAGGQPALVVDVANKVITPTKASLSISGGRPGGEALFPAGAALAVTGGTPTVEVKAAFEPFVEENVNRTNAPVPEGTTGAWVTLGGAGGGGGSGRRSNSGYRYGGGGGGGGAYVDRVFVPVELMGDTYTVTRGLGGAGGARAAGTSGGNNGTPGGSTVFSSGSVSLTASGGAAGVRGTSSSASGGGGAGGTTSISGVSATGYTGGKGGNGGSNPTSGQSRTDGSGAGGRGAGGLLSNDNSISSGSNGTSSGPAGNGGGGAAGSTIAGGSNAGSGGDGYNKIEWSNLPNGGA
ncbi:minor tail protein [Mycobacterium phage Kingsley]|nr:minor tail protein [Mycobacterium phage Kingsley]